MDIGAASRQELERVHAEHAAQTAAVQSARARLELLGVPAPIDGVITERGANVGLIVDPSTSLFTVVDLSTVWVVADMHERDFARVRVGSDALVTFPVYEQLSLRGRVDYIDPQVSPDTRTARIRVEVPNPRGDLRLGMYADVGVTGAPNSSAAVIPRGAVQHGALCR